jgi:uncharacterized membrane protein YoaK (UPF0700 family)
MTLGMGERSRINLGGCKPGGVNYNEGMGIVEQLDRVLTEYLVKKAPALPVSVKEFIVNFGPWISLILGLLLLPLILAAFGLGALFTPVAMMAGVRFGATYMLSILVAVVQMVLQFAAIGGLLKRQTGGWKLAFYGALVGGVYSLVSLQIIGLVIGTGLSLYVLYQIKSYYK